MLSSRFEIGQQVYSKSRQRRGRIVAQTSIRGEVHYHVDLGASTPIIISERDLEPVLSPLEQLATGEHGYASDFDLLARATALQFAYRYEGLGCLSNSRLDPKPHQIFVAYRVLQDLYPRYLLADEVGLGKTIEAGLILKELRARGLVNRVLIVVPASLCEQWQGEMAVKFNEQFYIYRSSTIRENLERYPRSNPWERDNNIITSLQFARQQTGEANQSAGRRRNNEGPENRWIDEVDWDLVIFDEAHHLRRYLKGTKLDSGHETTKAYRLGQALAGRAKTVLLLTATPLQLSRYEAFSLIELLDNRLFSSWAAFDSYMTLMGRPSWKRIVDVAKSQPFRIPTDSQRDRASTKTEAADSDVDDPAAKFGAEIDSLGELCLTMSSPDQHETVQADVQRLKILYVLYNMFTDLLLQKGLDRASRSGFAKMQKENEEEFEVELASFVEKYPDAFQQWILRQHKLSQVMIRNRKREVLKGEFVERRAYKVPVILTREEFELYNLVSEYIRSAYARVTGQTMALGFVLTTFRKLLVSSRRALAASLERRAERIEEALLVEQVTVGDLNQDDLEEAAETLESIEQLDELLRLTGGLSLAEAKLEVTTLREMAARVRAIPVDSKARMLLERVKTILDADPTEKVLVFTQFRETQTYLKELFENEGYQVALFHGEYGSAGYNKTAEFERFKKNPAVRIMLSTDVGGEGLNFQFCRVLFNYDLPWNPMRIEQRIGRLDRIGQERDVQIYNFFLQDTLDARILTVLQDRIRIFEETIGNLDPILGDDIERDIQEMVLVDEKTAQRKLAEFEQQAERRVREAREAETMLADFIMDARSFRRDIVDEILGRKPPVSNRDIEAFTCAFLGRYPSAALKMEEDNIITITVPAAFREDCRKLYGIHLEDQYRGTFDPQTAIKEDTVDFFAFGHLLVEAIIQYCTEHERNDRFKPQTAIRILHDPSLASYKGIQFNYVLCFDGVRAYKKLIPLVLDMQGDYDETVSGKIASLPTDEETEKVHRADISSSSVHRLQECSLEIIGQIAGKEKEAVQERNRKDYDDAQEKLTRLSEYHLRYQQDQLEQRQARLEDAR